MVLIAVALVSCSSSEGGAPSAGAKSTGSAVASTPAPAASPSTRASSTPTGSAPAASGSSKFACGSKEDPCPMQKWMRDNVGRPLKMEDKEKVVAGFKTISEHAPPGPGYDDWKKISEDGLKKAATDLGAAGEVCKQCHNAYQEKYRAELRDKPWP